MLMRRECSRYVDLLRDDLWKNHPQIHIVDFDFYDVEAFNQCENNNCVLMAIENWRYVHPLLKILPVEWSHAIPFGLLHSPKPSLNVKQFLNAVEKVTLSFPQGEINLTEYLKLHLKRMGYLHCRIILFPFT